MIKAAIFDLDGTILDSMGIWHDVDSMFLKECGINPPDDLSDRLKAMTIDECVRYFIDVLGVKMKKEEIVNRIGELIRQTYLTDIEAKPHVRKALEGLSERGIKMCIATANDYALACESLKRHDLFDYFEFIATCGQLGCSKTQPYIFEYCAERLGFEASETVVFEDSLHCIQAAKEAGFTVIGVYDKFSEGDAESIKKLSDGYICSWEDGVII